MAEEGSGGDPEPTQLGNRELIKVYVAVVNVYNCRGRGQVFLSRHVPKKETRLLLARSQSPLYVPFQFAFPSQRPEIFRKIGRTKSCFVVVGSNRLAPISRQLATSSNLLRSIFGRRTVSLSPISSLEEEKKKVFYVFISFFIQMLYSLFLSENKRRL